MANKPAWTPGPWRADWDDNGLWYIEPLGVTGTALRGDDPDSVETANAHLIAAAPDLYEALNDIMKCVEAGVLVRDTSRDHETGWALHQLPLVLSLKAAQQALSKARKE